MRAAAAARQELGGDYDGAVLESLVHRLDRRLDAGRPRRAADAVTVVIALGSIGFGVLFAAAADGLGHAGATIATIVAWVVIAIINIAHARSR